MPQFPSELRVLRRRLRLTQTQMADVLGVSLRQYQRWEHGTSAPHARELSRITNSLEVLAAGNGRGSGSEVERALGDLRFELDRLRAEVAQLRALVTSLA